ncbi:hypothetical protein LZ32DRAFT_649084 [Colletotrichum eremochloae]|nr:hypothetical protein LZ32DRAFT_649084 [Colletotrichum eremochloae]
MYQSGANSTAHQPTSHRVRSQATQPSSDNPSSESENTIIDPQTLSAAVVSASQAIHQSDTVLACHWNNICTAFVASGITTPFADWLTEAFGNHNLLTIVRAAFAKQWRKIEDSGSREVSRRRSSAKRLGLDGIWELYLWFGLSVQSQRCWRHLPPRVEFSARELFVKLCHIREQQQPPRQQKHHLEKPFGPREFELACCALIDRDTIQEPEAQDGQYKQDNRKQRQVERQRRVEEQRIEEERASADRQEEQGQAEQQDKTSKSGRRQHQMQDDDSGYFEDTTDNETEKRDHEQDGPRFFGLFDNDDLGAAKSTTPPQKPSADMSDYQTSDMTQTSDMNQTSDTTQTSHMAQRLEETKSKLAVVRADCAAKKSQWEEVSKSETSLVLKCKEHIDARVRSIIEEDVEDTQGYSRNESARGLGDLERDLKAAVSRKRKASRQIESLTAKSQRLKESEETMLALFDKALEEHMGRMQQEQETIIGPGADE